VPAQQEILDRALAVVSTATNRSASLRGMIAKFPQHNQPDEWPPLVDDARLRQVLRSTDRIPSDRATRHVTLRGRTVKRFAQGRSVETTEKKKNYAITDGDIIEGFIIRFRRRLRLTHDFHGLGDLRLPAALHHAERGARRNAS
jgi:hypothetical protein